MAGLFCIIVWLNMNPVKPKAIVFDADGMLIKGERVSTRLARDYGVPMAKISPFFENEFKDCIVGKKDLTEVIVPYIGKWGWKGTVADFLNFWFVESYRVDNDMLAEVELIRKSGIVTILATNQEKHRVKFMENEMGLKAFFDKIIVSSDIGCKKNQPEFMEIIAGSIPGIKPGEVLFFDDRQENVDAARNFGFQAELFTSTEKFKEIVGI